MGALDADGVLHGCPQCEAEQCGAPAPASRTLPKTVQIGPIRYQVALVDELAGPTGNLYGDISYPRCRIRIDATDDAQVQAVTLWHEVLHGAGVEEHDELTIRILSHGIVQVLRDNPELTAAGHGPDR
jgi:hypothetical protein